MLSFATIVVPLSGTYNADCILTELGVHSGFSIVMGGPGRKMARDQLDDQLDQVRDHRACRPWKTIVTRSRESTRSHRPDGFMVMSNSALLAGSRSRSMTASMASESSQPALRLTVWHDLHACFGSASLREIMAGAAF